MSDTVSETLLSTTIAGTTAASLSSLITYPLEYIKTRHQLFRAINNETFIAPIPGKIYFTGCSSVVTGNAVRALFRYSVYNQATKFMMDTDGTTSAPQIVVAGMMTGLMESLIVVPFESIKTTMIDRIIKHEPNLPKGDADIPKNHTKPQPVKPKQTVRPAAPQPQLNIRDFRFPVNQEIAGFFGNVRDMYNTRGIRSFIQGFGPTMLRQLSNSMVKFTSYNFMKQAVTSPNEPISSYMAVTLGFMAGAIQVVTTQPIDVIKTRMQSINALPCYRSSLICAYRLFIEEGPSKLWLGTLPRLIKVSFNGGIFFAIYEGTNKLVIHSMRENPFSA